MKTSFLYYLLLLLVFQSYVKISTGPGNTVSTSSSFDDPFKTFTVYGVLYDDYSHKPIENVKVELYKTKNYSVIGSVITDASGKYFFSFSSHDNTEFAVGFSSEYRIRVKDSVTRNEYSMYPDSTYTFQYKDNPIIQKDIRLTPSSYLSLSLKNNGKEDISSLVISNQNGTLQSFRDSVPVNYTNIKVPLTQLHYGQLIFSFQGPTTNHLKLSIARKGTPYSRIIEQYILCEPYKVTNMSLDF